MEKKIGVSDFKARCLRFLEQTRTRGSSWTITKKGEAIARVIPVRQSAGTRRGQLQGLGTITDDIVHWSSTMAWESSNTE